MDSASFRDLPLRSELLTSIAGQGYEAMTPVQAQTLPPLLKGVDVLAQASTGSGKTAAFAIGLLQKVDALSYRSQALVLCPTRELAEQVATEIRRLASSIANIKLLTLCGGRPLGPQLTSLRRAPTVVVGTPGRILKHLAKGSLKLDAIQTLVLDEADRMLDMGFQEDILHIIAQSPASRQTLLFSATYPEGIHTISATVQRDPVEIRVDDEQDIPDIEQLVVRADNGERVETLVRLLAHYRPESSLVFCNTKRQCQELAGELRKHDLHALALHGDLEQAQRDQVLAQFAGKSSSILVATDVAARGLDVKELAAVINFDLARDPETHIHRIGRTARAGSKGMAISLVSPADQRRLEAIETQLGLTMKRVEAASLVDTGEGSLFPPNVTLRIEGGRRDKIRAGDLLGALTANGEIAGRQVGQITLFDRVTYVAVEQQAAKQALAILEEGRIKGREYRVRRLR